MRRTDTLVLGLIALALLTGLAGGLVRMGWPLLPERALAPVALHGALMVCGFFGFVIALERAAALHRRATWAAPALAAVGTLAALALQPGAAAIAWLAAGLVLTLAYAAVLRRTPVLHVAVEGAGALCWAGGTLLWMLDRPFSVVVAWWAAFLVLTIAGERRELARFVPSFELLVDDLRRASDDSLASRVVAGFAKLALWLLRDGQADRLFDAMRHWAPLLDDLPADRLAAVVRYVDAVGGGDEMILEEFCANLELHAPQTRGTVMTYIERLVSESRQEGRQEGRREERQHLLRRQLEIKFGTLSPASEQRLAGASEAELARWIERVLFAGTLEQLFADEH